MRTHRRAARWSLAAIAAAVAALAGPALTGPAPAQAQPADDGLDIQVTAAARAGLAGAARSAGPDAVTRAVVAEVRAVTAAAPARLASQDREIQVSLDRADTTRRAWAFGTTVVTAPTDEHAAPQGWLFLARHGARGWTVGLEGQRSFARLAERAPLLRPYESRVLADAAPSGRTHTEAQPLAATGLQLPWAVGTSITMTGGPHGWDGYSHPFSSADFSGGDGTARAAGAGAAWTMCSSGVGWVRIIHDNGFSTDYYHLTGNIAGTGQRVNAGDFLGYQGTDVSCGGSASGPHVHFALRQYDANLNGWYVPLNGFTIGGWTFYEGPQAYGGYATDGASQVGPGGALYNYGPS